MEHEEQLQEELTTQQEEIPMEETPRYVPRPMWQVWAARVGLGLFIILLIIYYLTMFRGGYR